MFQLRKSLIFAAVLLSLSAWPALAGEREAAERKALPEYVPPEDAKLFAGVADPAQTLLAGLRAERKALEKEGDARFLDAWLDQVHRLEHRVPVADGYELAVTETFTLRSWLRLPHRAVVFLCGSVFKGNHFSIPVAGYDGSAMVAERAGFAFTVDYIGVGGSSIPANGRLATYERQREAVRTLVAYIRFFRSVPKVDLVGDGFGGSIAAELAADGSRVRSAAMSAMIYREVNGGPLTDPDFIALLESSPNGYFPVPGESSLIFMTGAPQAALDFVTATQGGFYPIDNFLVATGRPFFDPTAAQAPGLVFYGPNDFIAVASDIEDLAAEYGAAGATLAVHPAAGHAPRSEGPVVAAWYWATLFDFIDL